MVKAFKQNWRLYLCEAVGLAIFMISACFFSAMFEGDTSWYKTIPDAFTRLIIIGILMGSTALVIFYSPFTSPSGSQINPAVTITFLRLGKIKAWDAFFYIIFQALGGTLAVYVMAYLVQKPLTAPPVNYAATIPIGGIAKAFVTEAIVAFLMMIMVLFTSSNHRFKKHTRWISGCFVCLYVIVAGPISGFGMNPARSLASAIPSGTWTAFWIYALVPIASMLLAAEVFLKTMKTKPHRKHYERFTIYLKKEGIKILNDQI